MRCPALPQPRLRASQARLATFALCAFAATACASGQDGGESEDDGPRSFDSRDASVELVDEERACAMQSVQAERKPRKPLDVVFVIDNSGSMTEEIAAVRRNINENFAALIAESGADFRVVMLSRYGASGTSVCIEPPLAGAGCGSGLYGTNGERYFHYDTEIDSGNSLCRVLETFDLPDLEDRAPTGWQGYLRPEAEKAFVAITDDNARCRFSWGAIDVEFGGLEADPYADALTFHDALRTLSPEQFGVAPEMRYRFYSFVGLQQNDPAGDPWFPHEEVVDELCSTAQGAGQAYQALSVITDALRYPVCEGQGFDAIFRVLAQNVVELTKADCVFELPEAPFEQTIDRTTISLQYRENGDGEPEQLKQVSDAAECDAESFTLGEDQLELCPAACRRVQSDADAQLRVLYACVRVVQ